MGFFAILVPLWVLAPRNTAEAVFTQFTDGGNWGSIGLSCLIGIFSPVFSFIGPDSATHVSTSLVDFDFVSILNNSQSVISLSEFDYIIFNLYTLTLMLTDLMLTQ